jgi:acetate kinase
MMGTRCGDIDPSIHHYLIERGYKENDIANMLTKKSGLAGICGKGDFRDVCEGIVHPKNGISCV